jgi:hypothetical protein
MNYIIILFGLATIVAGVIIVINPDTVFGLLRKKSDVLGLHVLAVVARLILGTALIWCASSSKYPTAISIIGWITIVAAVVLGIMGRENFKRLMSWALGVSHIFARMGGILAVFIGAFLVYALV